MWSILANLAISFLGSYVSSPMGKQIINQLVTDLAKEGSRILPIAIESIKEIATDPKLTSKGKFNYVANKVTKEAAEVPKSLYGPMIDLAYRVLKNDPNVPEVPNTTLPPV